VRHRPRRLRIGITYGNVCDLPHFSTGPQGEPAVIHRSVALAGYEALQCGDPALCARFGLQLIGAGLLTHPSDADGVAADWKNKGASVVTCTAGFGMESDAEMDAYASAICRAADDHKISLLLETHRASITQDVWRTVQLCHRFPELRFNLDLSHWYTGQEMPNGDLDERMAFLEPVFSRTLFLHGRVGDRCCMQVPLAEAQEHSLSTFEGAWTAVMHYFTYSLNPVETELWFCPELLGPTYNYARQFRDRAGNLREETDRWTEAEALVAIARKCFAAVSELSGEEISSSHVVGRSHLDGRY
jgi:hypothetical protein